MIAHDPICQSTSPSVPWQCPPSFHDPLRSFQRWICFVPLAARALGALACACPPQQNSTFIEEFNKGVWGLDGDADADDDDADADDDDDDDGSLAIQWEARKQYPTILHMSSLQRPVQWLPPWFDALRIKTAVPLRWLEAGWLESTTSLESDWSISYGDLWKCCLFFIHRRCNHINGWQLCDLPLSTFLQGFTTSSYSNWADGWLAVMNLTSK